MRRKTALEVHTRQKLFVAWLIESVRSALRTSESLSGGLSFSRKSAFGEFWNDEL